MVAKLSHSSPTHKENIFLDPVEQAEFIAAQKEKKQLLIFNALSQEVALQVFPFLPVYSQKKLLDQLPKEKAALLLAHLTPDDRTNLLQDLPTKVLEESLKLLPIDDRTETLVLLGYPKGSVGRLMTPDYIAVKMNWTVEKVLNEIQAYGKNSETIDILYIIDNSGKLLDDINLKELLFVPRQSQISLISDLTFTALTVDDKDEAAIPIFRQYNRVALPVVDRNGILLGIVTIDDILRLSDQEATEDIQKIGGTEALDEPYMQIPFFELMKKRAGWLVILFIGETFTATAMSYFEYEISKAVVLALFLPLIISSGGNAGSQASTLIVRAMALGEVAVKDAWRVIRRELASGLFLGAILGTVGFLRVVLWSTFTNIYGEHWFLIALTIYVSLLGVVLWGTLSGAFLPLLLKTLKFDPAASSAPCVATIVDVVGIIIYFMTAVVILKGTLL